MNRSWCWIVALATVVPTGCTVGPNYRRPPAVATMPADYTGAGNLWRVARPQAGLSKGPWSKMFRDLALNRLEAQATSANQQLKVAFARFQKARASADVARSGLFPSIGVGYSALRQRNSADMPLPNTGQAVGHGVTYSNFTVPFDLNYELDLWGRVRREIQSARAKLQAEAADLEGVRLAIAAEVAADYFTLRALDAEEAALQATIAADRKSLELTRHRRTGGLASDLDVAQADTVLKTAETGVPELSLERARFEHALAVLTGRPAPLFHLAGSPLAGHPPIIPPGLPSTLLQRRPDIAAAERRMAAANANVGVATAAFFPTVELNGLAGFESIDAGTMFTWPSRLWAVGPSLSLPLFEGGLRRAQLRTAQAAYAETVADYRQTVLAAFAEVEDNLAAERLLAAEQDRALGALRAAQRQLQLAEHQYRGGLVSYLQVAVAENVMLQRQIALDRLRGERFVAAVALVKSLGGGWRPQSRPRRPASARASTDVPAKTAGLQHDNAQ